MILCCPPRRHRRSRGLASIQEATKTPLHIPKEQSGCTEVMQSLGQALWVANPGRGAQPARSTCLLLSSIAFAWSTRSHHICNRALPTAGGHKAKAGRAHRRGRTDAIRASRPASPDRWYRHDQQTEDRLRYPGRITLVLAETVLYRMQPELSPLWWLTRRHQQARY
jgi:hypothetical protein